MNAHVAPEVLAHLLLSYGFRFPAPEVPADPIPEPVVVEKKPGPNQGYTKGQKKISDEIARRVQNALRLALVGIPPEKVFSKFDKDKDGLLSSDEFRRLVRMNLRIPADKLSDHDIATFVAALDDDCSGTLGVAEVLDFVDRGTATFFSAPEEHLSSVQPAVAESPMSSVFAESKRERDSVGPAALASGLSGRPVSSQGSRAPTPDGSVSSGQRAAKQRIARSARARRPASAPGLVLPRGLLMEVASRSVTPALGDAVSLPTPSRPVSRASAWSPVSATPSRARPMSGGGSQSPYAPQSARPSSGCRPRQRPQSSTGFSSFKRGALDKMLFGAGDERKQWVHEMKCG